MFLFLKNTSKNFSLFVLLLAVATQATGQHITEYAPTDSLSVGDTFTLSIVVNKDQLYDAVIYPDSAAFNRSFEIRSLQRYQVNDFRDSVVYSLQYFGTRDTTLRPLPVHLVKAPDTTTLYTNPVIVHFKSVLQSDEEEFRPLKPIFDFARAWWPYLLLALLLLAAGWYLYRYYLEKSEQGEPEALPSYTPEPFENPLDRLKKNLDRLGNYPLTDPEDFKTFYIQLGDAIREYFERLYHIPALEMTSREILTELHRRVVDEELVEKTRDVLREADMVKFAKFTPTKAQAGKALEKASAFRQRAEEIDQARIDTMRRKHALKNKQEQQEFEEQQKQEIMQHKEEAGPLAGTKSRAASDTGKQDEPEKQDDSNNKKIHS